MTEALDFLVSSQAENGHNCEGNKYVARMYQVRSFQQVKGNKRVKLCESLV